MFRFRLTIDRYVTQEELQKLISALTFLKEGDTLSITQGEPEEKPVVKEEPNIKPFTNVIEKEEPHLPTTVPVVAQKEQLLLPDIIPTPSSTPNTDKLIEKAKSRISRSEKINNAITKVSEMFPDYADSLDLMFTQMEWRSRKDTWRLYTLSELSDFLVIPKEDLPKVMSKICAQTNYDIRPFQNDQIFLPKTFNDVAKEEEEQRKEIEDLNRKQTGDPNIGNGRMIVENRGILTETQMLKYIEKLDWSNPNKYSCLTNYELFDYFGIKEDMRNSMSLIRAIKKYHPEWNLAPYPVVAKYGISRIVNRFPFPRDPDPAHPFPEGR